jgi:hypothetical protein
MMLNFPIARFWGFDDDFILTEHHGPAVAFSACLGVLCVISAFLCVVAVGSLIRNMKRRIGAK